MFRKKFFLFTWGSYFWGYHMMIIKARDESTAVYKFLISTHGKSITTYDIKEIKYNIDYAILGDMSKKEIK